MLLGHTPMMGGGSGGGGGGILCINTWPGQSTLHISLQLEKVQSTTPLISPRDPPSLDITSLYIATR